MRSLNLVTISSASKLIIKISDSCLLAPKIGHNVFPQWSQMERSDYFSLVIVKLLSLS